MIVCVRKSKQEKRLSSSSSFSHSSCSLLLYPSFIRRIPITHKVITRKRNSQVEVH